MITSLLLSAAFATELDLTLRTHATGPLRLTLGDIGPGTVPVVEIPDGEGGVLRLQATLTPSAGGAYDVALRLSRRTVDRRGRVSDVDLVRPTVRVLPGEPGSVSVGARADGALPEDAEFVELTVLVREAP